MPRYEVIESKSWRRDDGRTASIYGAVPWTSAAEESRWKIVTRGYTVRDAVNGTVGIGRVPWATRAEADAWADEHNAAYDKRHREAAERRTAAQLDAEINEHARRVSEKAAKERAGRSGRRYGGVRPGGKRDV